MSLLDEARAYKPRPSVCSVASVLSALDDADAADLREALADPQVMGSGIALVLTRRGIPMKQGNVQRHRRGDCDCPASESESE